MAREEAVSSDPLANNCGLRTWGVVGPASDRVLLSASTALLAVSAYVTIVWCSAMYGMPAMPMPGVRAMSMTWMRGPEQTWSRLAGSFLGMWTVMMVAMMLPSLVPVLRGYSRAIGGIGDTRAVILTTFLGACYFLVWVGFGTAVFAVGVGLTAIEMHSSLLATTAPLAGGAAVLLAGVVQCSAWKVNQLARCRMPCWQSAASASSTVAAMRDGLCLGFHCVCCCCGLTVVLLVAGLMDLRAMAVVTAAITLERLAPRGERIARIIGALVIGTGLLLSARAAGIA